MTSSTHAEHGWGEQQTKQERSQNGLQETTNRREERTEADVRRGVPRN